MVDFRLKKWSGTGFDSLFPQTTRESVLDGKVLAVKSIDIIIPANADANYTVALGSEHSGANDSPLYMTPANGNRTVNQIYSYDRITQYSIENNTLTITFLHGTPVEDTRVRIYYFTEKVGV